ncbi:MAG: ABC transporter substrate-binding protein [Betaproteobacteria bacterium]
MNKRRRVVLALGAGALAPLVGFAQQQGKAPQIGLLISETLSGQAIRVEGLRAGLRDLGYVEGKNIVLEFRSADGNYDRLPELAQELVRLKVEVLVAFGGKAVLAAHQATTTIPIVVPSSGDPIAMGLSSSLARPTGNVTGSAMFTLELMANSVELLKEAVPRIHRIAWIGNSANPSNKVVLQAVRDAATALKLELLPYAVRSPKEIPGVLQAMVKARAEGVVVSRDTLFQAHDHVLAPLVTKHRLPSVSRREFAEKGGLIGYGLDESALYRRGAYFVDRILKGAKPSDLPIERPTTFELVVNMKTAKALGIKIPNSILLRAEKVIE